MRLYHPQKYFKYFPDFSFNFLACAEDVGGSLANKRIVDAKGSNYSTRYQNLFIF